MTAGMLGGTAVAGSLIGCAPKNPAAEAEATSGSSEHATQAASFEVAPDPIADADITNTIKAEVVVVGAGTAGLATALSAAQFGLNVVLISASSGPIARGGSNHACNSKLLKEVNADVTTWRDIQFELAHNSNMADQRKWARYYRNSEESMNWLIDIMENAGYKTVLEYSADFPEDSVYHQPVASHGWCEPDTALSGSGQMLVVTTLAAEFEAAGGILAYSRKAVQLVRGGVANGTEGRVDAVIAETPEGAYEKYIGSKAVVLATGDFSANKEMMEKYCNWAAPFFATPDEIDYDVSMPPAMGTGLFRGDGHQMGLWVGAAWQHNVPNGVMGGNICCGPWRTLQENFLGLLVNNRGERYMNEFAGSALGGMPALLQPNHQIFAIWDSGYPAFHEGKWYPMGAVYGETPALTNDQVVESWQTWLDMGVYVKCDTLEELIETLGLPESTLDTIARYNELCATGEDTDFFKDAEYLAPIVQGPFYGSMKDVPDAMTVLGGLRTNANMQVCDADDNPIEGLYNVGTMVGDFLTGEYTFQLQGVNLGASCVCFGYLTGKYIAENE